MMFRPAILVDTSIWSLVLRRKQPGREAAILTNLLLDLQVAMIGPIRQELLSGIREKATFDKLRQKLLALEDWIITTRDYETAAEFYNICRQHGVTGSHIDFLICAIAANNNMAIWTADKDFDNYGKYIPVNRYSV